MPYLSSFDPASVARITRLMSAAPVFARYYTAAMGYAVNAVVHEAQARAPVGTRPGYPGASAGGGGHGALRRGITGHVLSPWLGVVGVGVQIPYARRRERGFSGMTDRLGRFYPSDPGRFYLQGGLQAAEPAIMAAFHSSAQLAWREIAR